MTTPNSMPSLDASASIYPPRAIETPEMIERLAQEMRARSSEELPHAFFVDQVKRQLSGIKAEKSAANDRNSHMTVPERKSVFHYWALAE